MARIPVLWEKCQEQGDQAGPRLKWLFLPRALRNHNILVRYIRHIARRIAIGAKSCPGLIPDDLAFGNETYRSGTTRQVYMGKYVFRMLVSIAYNDCHVAAGP